MRAFIKKALESAKETGKISGTYTGWKDNVVTIEGSVKEGLANFNINRTWNGSRCSRVPVIGMPLTDKAINHIANVAAENL